jgi:hypothetical protein
MITVIKSAFEFFDKWRLIIVAVLAFAAGMYVMNYIHTAEVAKVEVVAAKKEVVAVQAEKKQIVSDVVKAGEKSAEIEKKVVVIYDHKEKLQLAAAEFSSAGITYSELCSFNPGESKDEEAVQLDDIPLTVGTVRVLNEARRPDLSADPAPISDEESRTPSATSVADLVQSDIDIAARYNELAVRHNELVDFVDQKLHQQANP